MKMQISRFARIAQNYAVRLSEIVRKRATLALDGVQHAFDHPKKLRSFALQVLRAREKERHVAGGSIKRKHRNAMQRLPDVTNA